MESGGKKNRLFLRGQTTIEYVAMLSVLLILLAATYIYSRNLDLKREGIVSQMEGERLTYQLSQAMDYAAIAGGENNVSLFLSAYPNQTLIVSGAEALALGPGNITLASSRSLAGLASGAGYPKYLDSNQQLRLEYDGTKITVNEQG
ncbi:MAG: hypothetical protein V1728_03490 [Candidatus Micrarchaeota archaeon]